MTTPSCGKRWHACLLLTAVIFVDFSLSSLAMNSAPHAYGAGKTVYTARALSKQHLEALNTGFSHMLLNSGITASSSANMVHQSRRPAPHPHGEHVSTAGAYLNKLVQRLNSEVDRNELTRLKNKMNGLGVSDKLKQDSSSGFTGGDGKQEQSLGNRTTEADKQPNNSNRMPQSNQAELKPINNAADGGIVQQPDSNRVPEAVVQEPKPIDNVADGGNPQQLDNNGNKEPKPTDNAADGSDVQQPDDINSVPRPDLPEPMPTEQVADGGDVQQPDDSNSGPQAEPRPIEGGPDADRQQEEDSGSVPEADSQDLDHSRPVAEADWRHQPHTIVPADGSPQDDSPSSAVDDEPHHDDNSFMAGGEKDEQDNHIAPADGLGDAEQHQEDGQWQQAMPDVPDAPNSLSQPETAADVLDSEPSETYEQEPPIAPEEVPSADSSQIMCLQEAGRSGCTAAAEVSNAPVPGVVMYTSELTSCTPHTTESEPLPGVHTAYGTQQPGSPVQPQGEAVPVRLQQYHDSPSACTWKLNYLEKPEEVTPSITRLGYGVGSCRLDNSQAPCGEGPCDALSFTAMVDIFKTFAITEHDSPLSNKDDSCQVPFHTGPLGGNRYDVATAATRRLSIPKRVSVANQPDRSMVYDDLMAKGLELSIYGGDAVLFTGPIFGVSSYAQTGLLEYVATFEGHPLPTSEILALPEDTPFVRPDSYKLLLATSKAQA